MRAVSRSLVARVALLESANRAHVVLRDGGPMPITWPSVDEALARANAERVQRGLPAYARPDEGHTHRVESLLSSGLPLRTIVVTVLNEALRRAYGNTPPT
jgi:hypothetical protein